MKILDMGCGKRKYKSKRGDTVIGVDKTKLDGVDVLWDFEKTPLPFKDNEFDIIRCSHVLEHVNNFFPLMEEIHRVLKPNGTVKIWCPYFTYYISMTFPDHKRLIGISTFIAFDPDKPEFNYYSKARFRTMNYRLRFASKDSALRPLGLILEPFFNKFPRFYERCLAHILPCDEIYVELKCVK